jgi:hypothetical protein
MKKLIENIIVSVLLVVIFAGIAFISVLITL